MRWFINYIQQCFCKHDFLVEEGIINIYNGIYRMAWTLPEESRTRVSMTCKKCGYHKKYWKY